MWPDSGGAAHLRPACWAPRPGGQQPLLQAGAGSKEPSLPKQGERDFGVSAQWLADATDAWRVVRVAVLISVWSRLCVGVGVGRDTGGPTCRDTRGPSCLALGRPLGLRASWC